MHDVEISNTAGAGGFALEHHHIHSQTTLQASYAKGEIKDLANLAFISATANKKIGCRPPSTSFPELLDPAIGRDELGPILFPAGPESDTQAVPVYFLYSIVYCSQRR